MKKIVRLTESDLTRIVKRVIMEQSEIDPKRVKFFDNLTNQISSKLIGKKIPFGKIGVLDNSTIVVQKFADRTNSVNLKGHAVNEFGIMFYVRRVEEDLYKGEKKGTRVWTGVLDIIAKFDKSGVISEPIINLYPMKNGDIDFSLKNTPTTKFTWDQLGGKDLWSQAFKGQSM